MMLKNSDTSLLRRLFTSPWLYASVLILLGGLHFCLYYDMPIARNSLVYGRLTCLLVDFADKGHASSFAASVKSFTKPYGFIYLSFPFVKQWGANIGLKVSSFLWTSLYILSIIPFLRRLMRRQASAHPSSSRLALMVVVSLFNPLVFSQFISAYPDTLFALSFLWSLFFLDRVFSKDMKWSDGAFFAFFALSGLWIKHSGLIIVPMFLIFLFARMDDVRFQWRTMRGEWAVCMGSVFLLLVLFGLAVFDKLPLFNLQRHRVDSYLGYLSIFDKLKLVLENFNGPKLFLYLSFGILSPLLLWWGKFRQYKAWYFVTFFFVLFTIPFKGTYYNIRYFIPLLPFLAWVIVNNIEKLSKHLRTAMIIGYLGANLTGIMYYNLVPFNHFVNETVQLKFEEEDNLRLATEQMEYKRSIAFVNEFAEDREMTMFFVSAYYKTGAWYVWERSGLFSDRLNVRYSFDIRTTLLGCPLQEALLFFYGYSIPRDYRMPVGASKSVDNFDVERLEKNVFFIRGRDPRRSEGLSTL